MHAALQAVDAIARTREHCRERGHSISTYSVVGPLVSEGVVAFGNDCSEKKNGAFYFKASEHAARKRGVMLRCLEWVDTALGMAQ